MRRIAVVGASGFVGAMLTEFLLASGRDEVVPMIHSSSAWRLARLGIQLWPISLLEPEDLDRALKGCTHVVNCSRGGNQVMLEGLRNLLRGCRANGVKRFVHLSSVMVYGDPPDPASTNEAAPTRPVKDTYGWIKLRQDDMVAAAARAGLPGMVLCPPNISGSYSDYLEGLVSALRHGEFALLDNGQSPCNVVDVMNLAHAIDLALDQGTPDGRRLFVTDGEDVVWADVVRELASLAELSAAVPTIARDELRELSRVSGTTRKVSLVRSIKHLVSSEVRQAMRKDPLWASVDRGLRRSVAWLGGSVEGRLRLAVEGPLPVERASPARKLNVLLCAQQLRGVQHSCERARMELGYQPLYSFAASMNAFRNWYRAAHGMDTPFWDLLRVLH